MSYFSLYIRNYWTTKNYARHDNITFKPLPKYYTQFQKKKPVTSILPFNNRKTIHLSNVIRRIIKKTVKASASLFFAWFNLIKLQKLCSDKVISVIIQQKRNRETKCVLCKGVLYFIPGTLRIEDATAAKTLR